VLATQLLTTEYIHLLSTTECILGADCC